MTRRLLITGANGYVGGRLAQALAREGGPRLRLGLRDVGTPRGLPEGAELVELDMTSSKSVEHACRGVQGIVHLAALNHADCERDPEAAFRVNTLGTLRLLKAAEGAKVEQVVYLSTAHVYGSPLQGDISEATATRPASLYAITHRAAEDLVLAADDRGRIHGAVLRLSNALGAPLDPRVNAWMLVGNDLCRQAVTTRRLSLLSSGLQVRDFVPMTDVVNAIDHVLRLDWHQSGDGLYNLSGETTMRIIDLAHRVAERCAKRLGFAPEISRPTPAAGETSPALRIRAQRLEATGFRRRGNIDTEIDATLELCQRSFGPPR